MAGQVKIYSSDLKALGSTSRAFSIAKTEELMREFTLSFSVVNNDSIYPLINENAVIEFQGQKFDISGIDSESGTNNITQITAEHISYRLADYTLPNNYSHVGTISQIANDILSEAKTVNEVSANTVFSIGTCANKGTVSFAISGTNITARDALISMSELGVEIEFNNFIVNIPSQRGADNGTTFSYDRNLSGIRRTWQKGNGWTYDINIADLQKINGHTGDTFTIGDYVTVNDTLNNTSFKDRIIAYMECDDPTQNRITVGVFIRDNASISIETDEVANCAYDNAEKAQQTADNSIQQGSKYSNVSITHTDGFKAVNLADNLRVVMNANDCFAVQSKQSNGTWKTVTSAELWGMLAPRLTTQDAKNKFYATVGKIGTNGYGMKFVYINNIGEEVNLLEIGSYDGSSPVIKTSMPLEVEMTGSNNNAFSVTKNGTYLRNLARDKGINATVRYKKTDDTTGTISINDGIVTSVS